MKCIAIVFVFVALSINVLHAQITTTKLDGGTVVTKLGMGIKVNNGSSLNRDLIALNNVTCPIQLSNVGIKVRYSDSRYSFYPIGEIQVNESITAYEIHHVLYDVFGLHLTSLSNSEITDINQASPFRKFSNWYATENQVSKFFLCVSYVARVRTKKGTIWTYNPKEIKQELEKIQILYEDTYTPSDKK